MRDFFTMDAIRDMRDTMTKEQRDWVRREHMLPMYLIKTIREVVVLSFAHVSDDTPIRALDGKPFQSLTARQRVWVCECMVEIAVKSATERMVQIA